MTSARKPHPHAEAIHAFADGHAVQFFCDGEWADRPRPAFTLDQPAGSWRVKPERDYQVTQMTNEELNSAARGACNMVTEYRQAANAALRHAIDAQQVVPMSEVQEIARNLNKSQHAKHVRDVAEAVWTACHEVVAKYSGSCAHTLRQNIDIDKIIPEVKT